MFQAYKMIQKAAVQMFLNEYYIDMQLISHPIILQA